MSLKESHPFQSCVHLMASSHKADKALETRMSEEVGTLVAQLMQELLSSRWFFYLLLFCCCIV